MQKITAPKPPNCKLAIQREQPDRASKTDRADLQIIEALLASRQHDEAERLGLALLEQRPEDPEVCRAMIDISRDRRDQGELAIWLERYLALRPNALEERASLLHIKARRGRVADLSDALALVEALCQRVTFDDTAGLRVLGLLQYCRLGRAKAQSLRRLQTRVEALIQLAAPPRGPAPGLLRFFPGTVRRHAQIQQQDQTAHHLTAFLACLHLALDDLDSFSTCVADLPYAGPSSFRRLHRVRQRITQAGFPDYGSEKVIGLGLSRTGTTSLNAALGKLGYHAVHWQNPLTKAILAPSDLRLFDAFTDISAAQTYQWIYHNYPNSKFVLTTRDADSWERSVRAHYQADFGTDDLVELGNRGAHGIAGHPARRVFWHFYGRFESWQQAYRHHHQELRDFFKDKDEGRFLELVISEGQGYPELCRFLGRDLPGTAFPCTNARARANTGLLLPRPVGQAK